MKKRNSIKQNLRSLGVALILPCLVLAGLFITRASRAGNGEDEKSARAHYNSPLHDPNMPKHIDARQDALANRGGAPIELKDTQKKATLALQNQLGGDGNLRVIYSGLTATPSRIINPNGYLTAASGDQPESIAREFIRARREMFRFTEDDLNSLKLQSRAVTQEGTTIMLFKQTVGGVPVYQGEVLVNVSRLGQIINVGGMNYPQIASATEPSISASEAVSAAAAAMNVDYKPESLGEAKILATYGNLTPEYVMGEKFAANGGISDEVAVQKVIFPLGAEGRIAYKFNLVTPQYHGIMWQNIIDAQTGEILQRLSLTAFQNEPGGGGGNNRRASFRPDVQNMLESNFQPGGASGKVFDTNPATLSGDAGAGRPTRTGTPGSYVYTNPTYGAEVETNRFRFSIINARNESPLMFNASGAQSFTQAVFPSIMGQVTRGFPDATYPSASSPFGWFYLPTGSNGAEIAVGDANRSATRFAGYTMNADSTTNNLAANSPSGDKTQPFAADLTPLGRTVVLNDGRTLNSVYQTRYTEGNNVVVAEDRNRDNSATRGIRGYAANRQFTAPYFDYLSNYEFGGTNATGGGTGSTTPVVFPASTIPDIFPGTVSLFYLNNLEHDYLYSIGFTEQMWNFQFDNFGKGGAGGDGVIAEVQDGSGTNNANMGTPDEGGSPTMQMFLFTDSSFRRSDGDFDWDVVAHEQYHGVSNRSAGKGATSCLGTPLVGESGGMGEGWSDFVASSMADDDSEGEHLTGDQDRGIRRVPYTNYRYSYGSSNGAALNVRRNLSNTDTSNGVTDLNPGGIPFEVHDIGEVWAAVLWDMRELMIVKQKVGGNFPGVFFDGNKRIGTGTNFYIGERQVRSVDAGHPINYRLSFATDNGSAVAGTTVTPLISASDIVRPGLVAAENASGLYPRRSGPLATALSVGARLADKIVLRGLQLAPCNPSFVDMRDSMIAADREITGGENVAVIWRSFASHGVGMNAVSPNSGTGGAAPVVEDFGVPANVSACELNGPIAAPTFTVANTAPNTATVSITAQAGAADYVIQRSTSQNGAYTTVGTASGTGTITFADNNGGAGLDLGKTYYYQVHARRNADCVGAANIQNVLITIGNAAIVAPTFFGADSVTDPRNGSSLMVNWSAAVTTNPNAAIVYDVYRVNNVALDTDLTAPTFAPAVANRIAESVTGTSYTDTGLTLGQQYYYIVRARDTNNGQIDTNNIGNVRTRYNAPSTVTSTQVFALENFETTAANSRFTPMLTNSTTPDNSMVTYQRVPNIAMGSSNSTVMFAADFDPANAGQGGPSNFSTAIGPLNITRASFLEFDHRFATEASFDGNNLEVVLGAPLAVPVDTTPFPNNTTAFELNDYIVEGGYTGALDAQLEGAAIGSPLQGRRSFTGTSSLTHVRAALGDFAPGGVRNPNSLPVYVRFHTSSDVGTNAGPGSGWYVDNLVVNNYVIPSIEADVTPRPTGDTLVDPTDVTQIRRFAVGLDLASSTGTEFQRADAAPFTTFGDGQIDALDIIQTRRYAIGLDALQVAQGPLAPGALVDNISEDARQGNPARGSVRVVDAAADPGKTVKVALEVNALGDEANYGFTLNYDQNVLSEPVVTLGAGAAGGNVLANTNQAGTIGFNVDFGGRTIRAGKGGQLVIVSFKVAKGASAGTTRLSFGDNLAVRRVANNSAQAVGTAFIDGAVVIGGGAGTVKTGKPSNEPAGIAGRVFNTDNRGAVGAVVTLFDSRGTIVKTIRTNSFGSYSFDNLKSGESYVVAVKNVRGSYESRTIAAPHAEAVNFLPQPN